VIYSSINDNWTRLEYLHSIASQLYSSTKASEFRDYKHEAGKPFKFCPETQSLVQQEACMVGMIQVWSVVTLESLANHAIAESFNNRTAAIIAIEYPDRIVKGFKGVKGDSDLGKKIAILNDDLGEVDADGGTEPRDSILILIADKLANIRNAVVHDKPFDYETDNWEGDATIKYFGNRNKKSSFARYEHLADFFRECDKVRSEIEAKCPERATMPDKSFCSLLEASKSE